MDITQIPNLPEKASESSETSDSESDSKDNSGTVHYYFKSKIYTYNKLITYKYIYYIIKDQHKEGFRFSCILSHCLRSSHVVQRPNHFKCLPFMKSSIPPCKLQKHEASTLLVNLVKRLIKPGQSTGDINYAFQQKIECDSRDGFGVGGHWEDKVDWQIGEGASILSPGTSAWPALCQPSS